MQFKLKGCPNSTFTEYFFILPGDLRLILIEDHFLINEEVQIDYREGRIWVGTQYLYFLKPTKEFTESPDQLLSQKVLTLGEME